MAWLRKDGYYYRSRKVGGRVVSEYIGPPGDPAAEREVTRDELERQWRQELRAEREQDAQLDADLAQAEQMTRALVRASLLLAGWHPHERTWRRRRNG